MVVRCAVLGSPVAHSLSPVLHRAAYAELGLTDWVYERHRVEADGLAAFVAGLGDGWRGLSMTRPLKEAALTLGRPDGLVELAGAANTMIIEQGVRRLHNTDIGGLTAALRAGGVDAPGDVVVLGAGGTTRAALVSLAALGTRRVRVLARRPEQVAELVPLGERLGLTVEPVGWDGAVTAGSLTADLLISTVTAGAADTKITELVGAGVAFGAVFDALYDPWPTPLALTAGAHGWPVINGLDLLVHQAVEQVELMTGSSVPAATLLSAGRKALSGR